MFIIILMHEYPAVRTLREEEVFNQSMELGSLCDMVCHQKGPSCMAVRSPFWERNSVFLKSTIIKATALTIAFTVSLHKPLTTHSICVLGKNCDTVGLPCVPPVLGKNCDTVGLPCDTELC